MVLEKVLLATLLVVDVGIKRGNKAKQNKQTVKGLYPKNIPLSLTAGDKRTTMHPTWNEVPMQGHNNF